MTFAIKHVQMFFVTEGLEIDKKKWGKGAGTPNF